MPPHPYQDPTLSIEARIADLLPRMTLAEKCCQLIGLGLDTDDGHFSLDFANQHFKNGISYVGSHHRKRDTRQTVTYLNAVQKFLREETRLGIPALALGEGLHGYMAHQATSFPQAIGLASAWDPTLHEHIFSVVAKEMRARGAHYALSPVLDVAREPRWGRTEETYGEDPYLISRLGVAAVRGLQGKEFTGAADKVLATAKHFAAHGHPEGGRNCGPANYSERALREELLLPFEAVVREGKIGSVMASYNEINGIPSHINRWLLRDVLCDEWGFEGIVVSDGWGVDDLYRLHFVAADAAEAAEKALRSGVELELGRCFRHLEESVQAGRIPEALVDAAVSKVLRVKFMLGLFENPFVEEATALAVTNCAEHKALALEAAHKTLVLLKNEGNLLPLDKSKLGKLAVIGPNAGDLRLGGYSGDPGYRETGAKYSEPDSIIEGIHKKLGGSVEILWAQGCQITMSGNEAGQMWNDDEILVPTPEMDEYLIEIAIQTAQEADVVLLVLGDNEQTCREAWSENHLGDRDSLDLPGRQEDLLRAMVATGRPIVLLLLNGRPTSINYAAEHIPAIVEGWYLGQAGGTAFADVLFGDVNPGGKLPITFPRSVGQLPAYYYRKPSRNRSYLFADNTPLYPFGHGLSYTTFAYSNPRLDKDTIHANEVATLAVDITNTGSRAGDEVAQFYVHDVKSEFVTRPVKLLRGFQRITLQPGETRSVSFPVGRAQLEFLNEDMWKVVEPGAFELLVGGSSETVEKVVLTVV